jgi:hypothetical protein
MDLRLGLSVGKTACVMCRKPFYAANGLRSLPGDITLPSPHQFLENCKYSYLL